MTTLRDELETRACVVCESGDHSIIFWRFDLPVSRCRRCGLVFANPRLPRQEVLKRYSRDYFWDEYLPSLGYTGSYDASVFDPRYAPHLQLLATDRPETKMLEIGVGAGFFLKAAAHAGWSVTGTEISPVAVEFGRGELGLDVRQMDADASLEFPSDEFDAVVSFEVIEHLLDPMVAMREARRLLRPGGKLMLSTPNYHALSRHALGNSWHVITPAEHLSYFTETTLADLLRRAGFDEIAFHRQFPAFGLAGTLNPDATHRPRALRSRLYRALVNRVGAAAFPYVQRLGLGDTLLVVAR